MMQADVPAPPAHQLVLIGVGRFAVFADAGTIVREPDGVRMRSLQVVEADFAVGETRYWGGWSWWWFDCAAGMADRLDFSSVAVGGVEGPATAEGQPAYPAAAGGDAAELMAVACGAAVTVDAVTVEKAVRIGREKLAD